MATDRSHKNALVTGGAGFIGSHLVDALLERGYNVTVTDNLYAGSLENLRHIKGTRRFRFKKMSMLDKGALSKIVGGHDVVFHLAAHGMKKDPSRKSLLADYKVDVQNNLVGTLNLLEAMVRHDVSDLVFASSSAIYGEAEVVPTPEEYVSTQTSIYGASKLASEAYAESFTLLSDLRLWAYRFGSVVGERCRRGLVWDFVHKLLRNPRELEVLGDGKQSKAYVYVKDTVDGMLAGYNCAHEKSNIFNIAANGNKTVDEVAKIVIGEMGLSNVRLKHTGGVRGWVGDNPVIRLDISKLKACGWKPRVSPDEAIRRTVRWTLENIRKA